MAGQRRHRLQRAAHDLCGRRQAVRRDRIGAMAECQEQAVARAGDEEPIQRHDDLRVRAVAGSCRILRPHPEEHWGRPWRPQCVSKDGDSPCPAPTCTYCCAPMAATTPEPPAWVLRRVSPRTMRARMMDTPRLVVP